jgi:hypothetical protein
MNTSEDGRCRLDELVLRDFSNSDDDGQYENMVKLPTPTLASTRKKRIRELYMHEGQICCTATSTGPWSYDKFVSTASVITARSQLKV